MYIREFVVQTVEMLSLLLLMSICCCRCIVVVAVYVVGGGGGAVIDCLVDVVSILTDYLRNNVSWHRDMFCRVCNHCSCRIYCFFRLFADAKRAASFIEVDGYNFGQVESEHDVGSTATDSQSNELRSNGEFYKTQPGSPQRLYT